ncbi:uncharacterized protein NESG_01804, partial [Nematocida ausubeli]
VWCFVIWIKTVALMGVALINICRVYISLGEVEPTLRFEITAGASHITINQKDSLNFLCGLIYQIMDCMYNKRFFFLNYFQRALVKLFFTYIF